MCIFSFLLCYWLYFVPSIRIHLPCLKVAFNFQIKTSYAERQENLCKYDRLRTRLYFQILWRYLDYWKILTTSYFFMILAIPCYLKITFVALKPYSGSTESYVYWLQNIFTCSEMLPLFSNSPISSLLWGCMVGDPVKTQMQWLPWILHPHQMW